MPKVFSGFMIKVKTIYLEIFKNWDVILVFNPLLNVSINLYSIHVLFSVYS